MRSFKFALSFSVLTIFALITSLFAANRPDARCTALAPREAAHRVTATERCSTSSRSFVGNGQL